MHAVTRNTMALIHNIQSHIITISKVKTNGLSDIFHFSGSLEDVCREAGRQVKVVELACYGLGLRHYR